MKFDDLTAPQGFASKDVTVYEPKLSRRADNRQISWSRMFRFGENGNIAFPANAYGPVRNLFDALNKNDNHQVAILMPSSGGLKLEQ
jgi:hypothetical protein